MEAETGLFRSLPLEIQAHIFSMSSLADVTSFALTCRYYQKEAWALIVTLNPTTWQSIVAQSVEMSHNVYIDDLFSDPNPSLIELAKIKQVPIFHRIFGHIDKCSRKLDKFELRCDDDFDDVKEDLLGAMERFPSFIQQVTALTLVGIPIPDTNRLLKLASSVEKLDWQNSTNSGLVEKFDFKTTTRLTSLTLRDFRQPSWESITQILPSMTRLQSLDLIDWRPVTSFGDSWRYPASLTRLGMMNVPFLQPHLVELLRRALMESGSALKQLDLRGTRIACTVDAGNVAPIQGALPNLEVIVGEYDHPLNLTGRWYYIITNACQLYYRPI